MSQQQQTNSSRHDFHPSLWSCSIVISLCADFCQKVRLHDTLVKSLATTQIVSEKKRGGKYNSGCRKKQKWMGEGGESAFDIFTLGTLGC